MIAQTPSIDSCYNNSSIRAPNFHSLLWLLTS